MMTSFIVVSKKDCKDLLRNFGIEIINPEMVTIDGKRGVEFICIEDKQEIFIGSIEEGQLIDVDYKKFMKEIYNYDIIDERAEGDISAKQLLSFQKDQWAVKTLKEWPEYDSEKDREREQVEWVFGLTGGELNDESFAGYRYNYDGVPDYSDLDDEGHITVISFDIQSPPKELEHDGEIYEFNTVYASSGEADCPICGAGSESDYWIKEFKKEHGRDPQPKDRCGLCETNYDEMPGLIYIGDCYEAVYMREDEE